MRPPYAHTPASILAAPIQSGGRRRRSFTLMELLAVIAIMSLVAAALAVNLGGSSDQTCLMQSLADLREMDARGRLLARTGESSIQLGVDPETHRIRLVDVRTGELVAERDASSGISIALLTDHPVDAILLDRAGRSVDYSVRIQAGPHHATLRVCGLSGLVMREASS